MARSRALGKGLGALIPGAGTEPLPVEGALVEVLRLRLEDIRPSPNQPRKDFDHESLVALADSIREHGVVQPVVVRKLDGGYEIVAGERRWRAAGMAGLDEVPVRVIDVDENRVIELSLVENLQREDLSPLEAAKGISELVDKFSLTQEQAARKLGWSRAAVANKLRLLNLPEELQQMLHRGDLSEGHARALLSLDDPLEQLHLARKCVDRGMSVREVEEAVRKPSGEKKTGRARSSPSVLIPEPVLRVSERYGIDIKMSGRGDNVKVMLGGLNEDEARRLFEMIDRSGEILFPDK